MGMKPPAGVTGKEYGQFLSEIRQRIAASQYAALNAVNKELISLYWDLGRKIVEKQEQLGWGRSIVETLATDLQKEHSGMNGFSSQNLWYMRQFYLNYRNEAKLQQLVGEISWGSNIIIFSRCKSNDERRFYLEMSRKFGWSRNILVHQIESQSYEKYLLNQTNFDENVPEKYKGQAKLAVKDEYTFDFLELSEEHSEKELENALIGRINRFLLEMGDGFCFVGKQYRLEIGDEEYFIDLVLYHRKLKSLVAIELKVGKFKPEYAGKMQFYLSVLNDKARLDGENPAIGIIICKEKNRTVVEYALKDVKKPIGIATYTVASSLPDDLSKYLPSKERIAEGMKSSG
jgi:predicted nuclease of restriction endonuclease-like (RecB) superfamily